MITPVLMPQLSATMNSGTVLAWYKAAGDAVAAGETILEIETDKSALTIEAPVSGHLTQLAVSVGDSVPVGTILVSIVTNERTDADATAPCRPTVQVTAVDPSRTPITPTQAPTEAEQRSHFRQRREIRASPRAQRLAKDIGLDVSKIRGTGPAGRVVRADVEHARVASESAPPKSRTSDAAPNDAARLRRRIAIQVSTSRREIPSFAQSRWIDMEAVLAHMAATKSKATATDYFLYAMANAASEIQEFTKVWDSATATPRHLGAINIGVVVGIPGGLVVPVLEHANRLGLNELARRRREAVLTARAGRLDQKLIAPASLSLSSLIHEEADAFEGIIMPGETALLAVGRLIPAVVPRDGVPAIRRGCTVTLSIDHRVVDGRPGAQFLGSVAWTIENCLIDTDSPTPPRSGVERNEN